MMLTPLAPKTRKKKRGEEDKKKEIKSFEKYGANGVKRCHGIQTTSEMSSYGRDRE